MIIKLNPDSSGIAKGVDAIQECLTKFGLKRKDITKAMLVSEEVMASLLVHHTKEKEMQLSIRRFLGDITIEISVPGESFDFTESMEFGVPLEADNLGHETEITIRNIILKSFADDLKYKHQHGLNMVRLNVVKSKHALLYRTMGAMFLAIILGIIFKSMASDTFNNILNTNILVPVKTMFMNALKMVVTPVVFFSIVSCISQFGSLSEMGKIGGKVLSFYLFTTVIATGLGIGSFYLFKPGNPETLENVISDASSIASQQIEVSLIDTVVNIVPSNFIQPFLNADMLQLIFIAVFCGIAVGMIGNYSKILMDFFSACNELFLKITVLLVKFMPFAAFASIMSMILKTGTQTLLSVLSMCATLMFALFAMMAVYCILMVVLTRLNPVPFIKKYAPTMLQVFSMASSNASLPLNMDVCNKKLGISPKVYSLALPLGATMNMDGTCIYLGVFALALARIYGVEITSTALMSIIVSIIVLSVGAPGVPGSGLICLSVLLTQLGVPVEAVGLVMGIDPLVGMLRCMSNCLGDVVACVIVSKSENLMNPEVFRA